MESTLLILLRHGQSTWNEKNLFTGWVDVPLSQKGVQEAFNAGEMIKHLPIDMIFTSTLIRAEMTAMLAMLPHQSQKIPVVLHPGEGRLEAWGEYEPTKATSKLIPTYKAWELNERMYGKLQGKNKQEMRELYGEEQIKLWRRSYKIAPPDGESLEMTAKRTIPYFLNVIDPQIKQGKNVFVSAHGNSLRSIVMNLNQLSEEEVVSLEIPTGLPIIYVYKKGRYHHEPL